jgi:DNA-binding transcriptional LysR family regulator
MLAMSPKNPLAKLKSVPVSVAVEQPLIFPKAGYTRQIMDKLFRPYQSQLRIAMELPSIAMIKTFVASGLGVSMMSESFAQRESRAGEIRLIPLKDVELWRELGMIHDRHRTLPRAAVAFIKLIRKGILGDSSPSGEAS